MLMYVVGIGRPGTFFFSFDASIYLTSTSLYICDDFSKLKCDKLINVENNDSMLLHLLNNLRNSL